MKYLNILFLFSLLTTSAWAFEDQVCRITSNTDNETTDYYVNIENGRIHSMRLLRYVGTRVLSDDTFSVEDVMDGGVVTVRKEGREVVRLKVENFTPENGGIIVQDYLYNGLSNSRGYHRSRYMKVNGDFVYTDLQGKIANRMFYYGRWILGRLVGISNVQTSYDPDGF